MNWKSLNCINVQSLDQLLIFLAGWISSWVIIVTSTELKPSLFTLYTVSVLATIAVAVRAYLKNKS